MRSTSPDELIRDYLARLPLVAPALRNRLDDIVSGDHDGWFSTALGAKDVGWPTTSPCHTAYRRAREALAAPVTTA